MPYATSCASARITNSERVRTTRKPHTLNGRFAIGSIRRTAFPTKSDSGLDLAIHTRDASSVNRLYSNRIRFRPLPSADDVSLTYSWEKLTWPGTTFRVASMLLSSDMFFDCIGPFQVRVRRALPTDHGNDGLCEVGAPGWRMWD